VFKDVPAHSKTKFAPPPFSCKTHYSQRGELTPAPTEFKNLGITPPPINTE
jgi:hypothetical protein